MDPLALETSCALTAVALSDRRREGARLMTGARRSFSLNPNLSTVYVPHPAEPGWTRRTLTCGVALQCSPSKERIAQYRLADLSPRERLALTFVESQVALGWVAGRWPGLVAELQRMLPDLDPADPEMPAAEMVDRAIALARTRQPLAGHSLTGTLPAAWTGPGRLASSVRRLGRMPWSSNEKRRPRPYSVPVGGDGGVRNTTMPPPSHSKTTIAFSVVTAGRASRTRSGTCTPAPCCQTTSP